MKDCTTCKYGFVDEQFGFPMCHHPSRFSEDCVDFNMHEEKEEPKKVTEIEEDKLHDGLEEAAEEYTQTLLEPWRFDSAGCRPPRESFIAGAEWQAEQFEKNRLAACDAQTEEEYERETDFAYNFIEEHHRMPTFNDAINYGAEWQKAKMLEEAIHYVVQDDLDPHGVSYNIPFIRIGEIALKPKGIGVGDKVKIIIVKEDEK